MAELGGNYDLTINYIHQIGSDSESSVVHRHPIERPPSLQPAALAIYNVILTLAEITDFQA